MKLGYLSVHLYTIEDIGLCLLNWCSTMLIFCTLYLPVCSTYCTRAWTDCTHDSYFWSVWTACKPSFSLYLVTCAIINEACIFTGIQSKNIFFWTRQSLPHSQVIYAATILNLCSRECFSINTWLPAYNHRLHLSFMQTESGTLVRFNLWRDSIFPHLIFCHRSIKWTGHKLCSYGETRNHRCWFSKTKDTKCW